MNTRNADTGRKLLLVALTGGSGLLALAVLMWITDVATISRYVHQRWTAQALGLVLFALAGLARTGRTRLLFGAGAVVMYGLGIALEFLE